MLRLFPSTTIHVLVLMLLACTSCGRVDQSAAPVPALSPDLKAKSLPDRLRHNQGPRFELLGPEQTGVDFIHHWVPPEQYTHDLETQMAGGGVTIGDYDGDGRPDVYLSRPYGGSRLYRNLGDCRFQDVTQQAGIVDDAWGGGVCFVDIDNDDDLDLYVCIHDGPNRLFVNQGDATFVERAQAFGLDFHGASVMMAFADYDSDGDLDGYLLTNRKHPSEGVSLGRAALVNGEWVIPEEAREYKGIIVAPDGEPIPINAAQYDHLYRNDGPDDAGQIRFVDVSDQAGITGPDHGLGVVWWDYNADGHADIYVANDFTNPDYLYHNNGDGTFTNIIASALPHTPWFSMGTDFGDINNDGRLDVMASDMSGSSHYNQKIGMGEMGANLWFLNYPTPRQYMRNAVYLNAGTDRFLEAAYLTGLADTDWTWTVRLADLDEDGWVDAFVTNGMTRDWQNSDLKNQADALGGKKSPEGLSFWLRQRKKNDANLAFRNGGNLNFSDVSQSWGLAHRGVSFGAAFGDLDSDGDLDIVVNNFEEPAGIYKNHTSESHRITVRLVGSRSNRFGLGARLQLESESGSQIRYLSSARGFMSASEPLIHFGVGNDTRIKKLVVFWPSGTRQQFDDLPVDQQYWIYELAKAVPARDATLPHKPKIFRPNPSVPPTVHREASFDDFDDQPLLPKRLSQQGPGIACADVDGDGDDDLYVSGAAGQPGQLLLNQQGRLLSAYAATQRVFDTDRDCEDLGCLFLDADGDGDQDLYVVSGGVEVPPGDPRYRDRLYLNHGQGQFERASAGALPDTKTSGMTIAGSDFDRDGDVDLFVGGRVRPGSYPLAPPSLLLRNESSETRASFADVTEQIASGLGQSGMITAALWSDVNNDGWIDLLLATEWGPIQLWLNNEGRFSNATEAAGLDQLTGWWNGITGRDLDNDGDIDYVVTNFGLNTKYHASKAAPVEIYYGDFDGSGRSRIVEAEYENESLFPIRGRSCSTHAIPLVGQRFKTYHDFAVASLADIYTSDCLSNAQRFSANTLESGVLWNNGRGAFEFRALPRLAQISPSFGVVATELDGDGVADIYLAQNFFGPQPETGRMDGGVSLMLRGQISEQQHQFVPVWPDESGLVVPGDATAIVHTDLNRDGLADLIVGMNDGRLRAFQRGPSTANRFLTVYFQRAKGPTVGTLATVELDDGTVQTAELYAGSGYLSQSTAALTFGLGTESVVRWITVRWPDGTVSTHDSVNVVDQQVVLQQPAG